MRAAAWMAAAALLSAAAPGPAAAACEARPDVYVGAIRGANDLAEPAGIRSLTASPRSGFYLTSYALAGVAGLRAKLPRIRENFDARPGIIEVGTNPVQMPDVVQRYGRHIDDRHGWTWPPERGAAWPADVAAAGWRPEIALLNPFDMQGDDLDDPYYRMNLLALRDVREASPGLRHVLPFTSPNAHVLTAENHELQWSDSAWRETAALATAAGGLALDTPGNYFTTGREEAYRNLVAQQIRWANERGFVSVVLISPYELGGGGSNGADTNYLQATQQEVAYLHAAGADPTIYVAANYAEAPAAVTPATETTPNSISEVALWLVRNAATSPFPASWRAEACAPP